MCVGGGVAGGGGLLRFGRGLCRCRDIGFVAAIVQTDVD